MRTWKGFAKNLTRYIIKNILYFISVRDGPFKFLLKFYVKFLTNLSANLT